jgi:hypothetical protein
LEREKRSRIVVPANSKRKKKDKRVNWKPHSHHQQGGRRGGRGEEKNEEEKEEARGPRKW